MQVSTSTLIHPSVSKSHWSTLPGVQAEKCWAEARLKPMSFTEHCKKSFSLLFPACDDSLFLSKVIPNSFLSSFMHCKRVSRFSFLPVMTAIFSVQIHSCHLLFLRCLSDMRKPSGPTVYTIFSSFVIATFIFLLLCYIGVGFAILASRRRMNVSTEAQAEDPRTGVQVWLGWIRHISQGDPDPEMGIRAGWGTKFGCSTMCRIGSRILVRGPSGVLTPGGSWT